MCSSFPLGFEGGMWDLIVLVPDHCLSFFLYKLQRYLERGFCARKIGFSPHSSNLSLTAPRLCFCGGLLLLSLLVCYSNFTSSLPNINNTANGDY